MKGGEHMNSEDVNTNENQAFNNQNKEMPQSTIEYVNSLTNSHRSAGPVGYKVDKALKQYDSHLDTKYNQFKVFQIFAIMRLYHDWPKVIGPLLGKQTRLLGIEPPIIKVSALNSPCLQQLQMMKRQLLQKINAYYGKEIITDIQLSMYKQSYIKDERQVYYGTTHKTEQYERPLLNFEAIPISNEELAAIDKVVAVIADPTLRDLFRETQIKQYKKTKYLKSKGYHTCVHCDTLISPEETICTSCVIKAKEKADYEYRQHIERIKDILFEQPYLVYEDICKQIPKCAMHEYQLAHRECVYFFRNRVIREASNDNYDIYMLLMLITHKKAQQLEKEFVQNAIKKMRFQYEQKRANYEQH